MSLQTAHGFIHPDLLLNANDRRNWREEHRIKADLRVLGRYEFGRQLQPVKVRTLVTVTLAFTTRSRRDAANWHPSVKPLVDGLTDAGIWPDDNDDWVEGPDVRLSKSLTSCVRPMQMRRVEVWVSLAPAGVGEGYSSAEGLF